MTIRRMQGVVRQADARALAGELAAALAAGDAMVDLAGVSQVDAGVLQVLVAAGAQADRMGRRLHLNIPEGSAVSVLAQALALPPVWLPVWLPMPETISSQADAGQMP